MYVHYKKVENLLQIFVAVIWRGRSRMVEPLPRRGRLDRYRSPMIIWSTKIGVFSTTQNSFLPNWFTHYFDFMLKASQGLNRKWLDNKTSFTTSFQFNLWRCCFSFFLCNIHSFIRNRWFIKSSMTASLLFWSLGLEKFSLSKIILGGRILISTIRNRKNVQFSIRKWLFFFKKKKK